jgi:SRSO17 transposase
MTPAQIAGLGPQLTDFLRAFEGCFFRREVLAHLDRYCRGLLSDLPRKSVEPMALQAGCAVRSLQEFLTHLRWDQGRMRDALQRRVAASHTPAPGAARAPGDLGLVGLIDECAQPKKGGKTPGVQRQYCGASGKIDNCIVNVHLACLCGGFKALLDSDLYLPQSWADDPQRCNAAHIPEGLGCRPKTDIAARQVKRALGNGLRFDWLTFDEGYGKDPGFLFELEAMGQRYVAEVPASFRCWGAKPKYHSLRKEFATKEARNVVRWSKAFILEPWRVFTLARQTLGPQAWHARAAQVWLRDPKTKRPCDRTHWLIHAWNRRSGEHKYFVSDAPPTTELGLLLRVAFGRANVEHVFRVAKSEVGMDHYEGRSYLGLMRHLVLCQLVLLFLAEATDRLRGEKPGLGGPDAGADGAGAQRLVRALA